MLFLELNIFVNQCAMSVKKPFKYWADVGMRFYLKIFIGNLEVTALLPAFICRFV